MPNTYTLPALSMGANMSNLLVNVGIGSYFHSAYRGYKEARANGSSVLGSLDNFALGGVSGATRIAITALLLSGGAPITAAGMIGGVAVNEVFNLMTAGREENMRIDKKKFLKNIPVIGPIRNRIRSGLHKVLGEKILPQEHFGEGIVVPSAGTPYVERERTKEQYLKSEGVKKFIKAIKITQSKAQQKTVPVLNPDGTAKLDTNGTPMMEFPYQKLRDALSDYIPGYDQDDITETDDQGIIENILRKAVNTDGGLLAGKTKKEVLEAIEKFGDKIYVYEDIHTLISLNTSHRVTNALYYSIFNNGDNAPLLNEVFLSDEASPLRDKMAEIINTYKPKVLIKTATDPIGTKMIPDLDEIKRQLKNNPMSFLQSIDSGTGMIPSTSTSPSATPRAENKIIEEREKKRNEIITKLQSTDFQENTLKTKKQELIDKLQACDTSTLANYKTSITTIISAFPNLTRVNKSEEDILDGMNTKRDEILAQLNAKIFSGNTEVKKQNLITRLNSCDDSSVTNYERDLLAIQTSITIEPSIAKSDSEIIFDIDEKAKEIIANIKTVHYSSIIERGFDITGSNLTNSKNKLIRDINACNRATPALYEASMRALTSSHNLLQLNIIGNIPAQMNALDKDEDSTKNTELNSIIRSIPTIKVAKTIASPEVHTFNDIVASISLKMEEVHEYEEPQATTSNLRQKILKDFFDTEQSGDLVNFLEKKLTKENYVNISRVPPSYGGMRPFNEKHDTAIGGKKYGIQGIMQYTYNQLRTVVKGTIQNNDGTSQEIGGLGQIGSILNLGNILAGKELYDLATVLAKKST